MIHPIRRWIRLCESILQERKQVGVLYHFTDFQTGWVILNEQALKTKEGGGVSAVGGMFVIDRFRDWVSLTRNFDLRYTLGSGGKVGSWGDCRIAIDGEKLSERNRIEPYHDEDHYLSRQDNQAEERVRKREVSLKGCILQVDVLVDAYMQNQTDWDQWVNVPEDDYKAKVVQMAKDDLATFFRWCQQEGIPAFAVEQYRPVRRAAI